MSTQATTDAQSRLTDIESSRAYLGGLSRSGIYDLIRKGELRTVTIGRRRFVDRLELDRFVDDRANSGFA